MSEEKNLSLEEAFEELDDILDTLGQADTSLEESFQAYKEGVELVKLCNRMIDRVEKEVKILSEGGTTGGV